MDLLKLTKKIIKYGNINTISKNNFDVSILNHKKVKKLFTEFNNYINYDIPYCSTPNYNQLLEFLINNEVYFDNYPQTIPFPSAKLAAERTPNPFFERSEKGSGGSESEAKSKGIFDSKNNKYRLTLKKIKEDFNKTTLFFNEK